MRKVLVTAVVIGAGAVGFAAVSQAGISLRPSQSVEARVLTERHADKYQPANCRIEKTLSYDFDGNPYMKKVRICA
ncbi:hypothetical protein [Rhizobium sp.]